MIVFERTASAFVKLRLAIAAPGENAEGHECQHRDRRDNAAPIVDIHRAAYLRYQVGPQRVSVFIIDPAKKIRLIMTYPMSVGRNFDEILRVVDSLQLSDRCTIATPANWKVGDEVIIPPSISDEDAAKMFPQGFTTIKPYLRTTKVA